ncbi:MAG: SMP-30/gluconolactonase/LRE family protein [Eubacterium aggregans]|nr:SMP-30/gluconolactonase/LRE family protein [Eubacterium aggregans]
MVSKMEPFGIAVYDEAFRCVFDKDTPLEELASGFRFVEGPVWDAEKQILVFSDIMGNALYQLDEAGHVQMIRPNSYLANGNTMDRQGNLLTCEHGTSRISRTKKDGTYEVLADQYKGKALNSPNDIICDSQGNIYFTDPIPGRMPRVGIPRPAELSFRGVYKIDVQRGELHLIDDTLPQPNGLCLSKDEQRLYVNDSIEGCIRVYHLDKDENYTGGAIFAKLKTDGDGCADGLKINDLGMVFCSAPGGIQIFDETGNIIGRIFMPQVAANFTFGGPEQKDLYITATSSVYRIKSNIRGLTKKE